MLRDGAAERQNAALVGAACVHGLKPMERLVLLAYVDAQAHHGHTGVCWPTDGQVAAFLGTTVFTVRRARLELARAAFIEVTRVEAGDELPDGSSSRHGVNVVAILGMVPGASGGTNPGRAAKRQGVDSTPPAPALLAA